MEDWQKDHIKSNLLELVSKTRVSAVFLTSLEAKNMLSDVEVDQVSTMPVNADKALQLYRFLPTRHGGYVALLDALHTTTQSGVIRVLLSSIPDTFFEKLTVVIGTANVLLAKKLSQKQMEDFISWVKNDVGVDTYKMIVCSGGSIKLVTPCIPESDPLYIPRYLSRRLIIDVKVFKVEAKDIFVFKNLSRLQIRNCVGYDHEIGCSSDQLFKITCRFILLDKETHWNELRNKASSPTHLITFMEHNNTVSLVQTTGGSELLQKYLKYGTNETGISENEFFSTERTENEKGLCICDSPGMGKTKLLANLAKAIQAKHPGRIVSFISLLGFTQAMKEKCFNPINFDACKNFLMDWMSSSPLTKYLLQLLLDVNFIQMELFFDGLDEVQIDQLDAVTRFLALVLDSMPNCRVYATSRTHVRKELESATRFIAYDIIPFDEEAQIQYLVLTWKNLYPANQESRLQEFAGRCVRDFEKIVTDNDRKLLGVPLQCKLFADIYSESARIHSLIEKRVNVDYHFVTNIWEMYKKFMEQRLVAKSECNFQCMLKPKLRWLREVSGCSMFHECSKSCKLKSYHAWMALKTIFPSFTEQIIPKVDDFKELSVEDVLRPGVLVKGAMINSVQFLHRSFAEYLCAEFFASQLLVDMRKEKGNTSLSKLAVTFLMKDSVKTTTVSFYIGYSNNEFTHQLVVHFFENFAKSWSILDCSRPLKLNYLKPEDFFDPVEVASAALKSDHSHLLQFCLRLYLRPQKSTANSNVSQFLKMDTQMRLLNTATKYSKNSTTNILIDLFKELANIDLFEVCQSLKRNESSPLEIAVKNREFSKVLMFYDEVKPDGRGLIYKLVEDTYEEEKEAVEERKDICDLLLGKYPSLLVEEYDYRTGPVVANEISLELVIYLVEKGADIRAVRNDHIKGNLIQNASFYMNAADFHKLTEFVIYDQKSPDLFTSTNEWLSPIPRIFTNVKGLKLETVQLIFSQTAANVNELDNNFYNLIQHAIEGHQSIAIIKYLESRGVSLTHCAMCYGSSLHIALRSSHNVAAKYIISLNCIYIEELDVRDRTPILVAAQTCNLEMIEYLWSLGANLFALDNKGGSILMYYVDNCEDPHELHSFVAWLKQKCELTCPPLLTCYKRSLEPKINKSCLSELFGMPNKSGITPIMAAFRKSIGLLPETLETFLEHDKSRLGKLLKHPVDINAAHDAEKTVLHFCVHEGQPVSAVNMLVENGLDWKVKNKHQCNVTHYCVQRGKYELLKYFVGLGCDVNEVDKYGNNALQCSFHFKWEGFLNEETLTVLVHSGLSFDNANLNGKTALMMLRESDYYKDYGNLSKFERYFEDKRF